MCVYGIIILHISCKNRDLITNLSNQNFRNSDFKLQGELWQIVLEWTSKYYIYSHYKEHKFLYPINTRMQY